MKCEIFNAGVALIGRAAVLYSACWGFESSRRLHFRGKLTMKDDTFEELKEKLEKERNMS